MEAHAANVPSNTDAARRVRLLTLTTLFPNACAPRHGVFVATRLRKLCDTGRVTARVVAPVPWFPGAYRAQRPVPPSETVEGLQTAHPRYWNVPGVGMRLQPAALARAWLSHFKRSGEDATRFDAVDAHYFYPDGVAAARIARALGLPLVISARGSDINVIGDIDFARRQMVDAAHAADALIAVSAALAERMVALGMPRERVHVLRNGVDTALFRPEDRASARARLGLREAQWVLAVGNLVPEKRFHVLIDAIAGLPDARLLIVGEGRLRGELASHAARAAPGRVELRPNMPQAELRFAYAACDVLGLPSAREGWPNVVLEAIACGTPVAAAPVGGVPEMLRPGAPAIIVDETDARAWQAALRTLIDRDVPRAQVRHYALGFGWEDIVERQCTLYERVAAARRARVTLPCG
ncbi:MAG TPA: glycosyltransferase [Casimicrobiaceae bacterium]|jgi:glycosyltransferase involved in cell wall biosynthesis